MPSESENKVLSAKRLMLESVFARLHVGAFAAAAALIGALLVALPTAALLLQDAAPGQPVGSHLSRLGMLFPGYSVSGWGLLVGALYGAASAAALGALIATLWNGSRLLYLRLLFTSARLRTAFGE